MTFQYTVGGALRSDSVPSGFPARIPNWAPDDAESGPEFHSGAGSASGPGSESDSGSGSGDFDSAPEPGSFGAGLGGAAAAEGADAPAAKPKRKRPARRKKAAKTVTEDVPSGEDSAANESAGEDADGGTSEKAVTKKKSTRKRRPRRKAVVEDDDSGVAESEEPAETAETPENQDGEDAAKPRRKRRRSTRPKDEDEADVEDRTPEDRTAEDRTPDDRTAEVEDHGGRDAQDGDDDDDDDEGARKRRRRGSRGGRRRRRSDEDEAASVDVIPGEEDDVVPERGSGDDESDADTDEESGRTGKKRRRRRRSKRKGTDEDGAEQDGTEADPDSDVEAEAEEEADGKKKRKRTRSKKESSKKESSKKESSKKDGSKKSAKKAAKKAPAKTAEEKAAEAEAMRTQTIAVNAVEPEERRVAVFEDDEIIDLLMNAESQKTLVNDIYRGRVVNLEPAIGAAFIDFGQGRNGFLHTSDVLPIYGDDGFRIDDLLTAGHHDEEGDHDADWSEEADALDEDHDEDDGDDGEERKPDADGEGSDDSNDGASADSEDEEPPARPKRARRSRRKATRSSAAAEADAHDEGASSDSASEPREDETKDGDAPAAGGDDAPGAASSDGAAPGFGVGLDGAAPKDEDEAPKASARRRRPRTRVIRSRASEDQPPSPLDLYLDSDDDGGGGSDDGGATRKKRTRRTRSTRRTSEASDSGDGDAPKASKSKGADSDEPKAKRAKKKSSRKKASKKKASKSGDDSKSRSKRSSKSRDKSSGRGRGRSERRPQRERRPIDQLLKVGDSVVVQITKDAIGDKGPTLTTYISMPGRYLVLMPSMSRTGVSRKIPDEKERKRLKRILASLNTPRDMGVIVRTAGVGRTKADLQRDLDYLLGLWDSFGKKLRASRSPSALYLESDVATRTLRDLFNRKTKEVIVDDHAVFEQMVGFAERLMPEHVGRIRKHDGDRPLFQHCGIEQDFEKVFSRRVDLPSGGSVVFDQAEALVAIDVNSGRTRTDSYDFEEIALKTNLEAVPEIARQIRLRDLGGIIVCDFIDMMKSSSNRQVERALRDSLADDRARSKLGRISQFGLLELTRQRLGPGTHKKVFQSCHRCRGTGRIRTVESRAQSILRRLGGAVAQKGFSKVEVRAHPEVVTYLKEDLWDWVRALEHRSEKSITLTEVPDQAEDSVLRYLRADGREVRPGGRRKR